MFKFPHGDLHSLNLDWLLEQWKNFVTTFTHQFTASSETVGETVPPSVTVNYDPDADTYDFHFKLPSPDAKYRRFLYIGDSYNTVTSAKWTDDVDTILGLTDSFVIAQGGYGFQANGTKKWETLLASTTIPDEDTITDICIVGGANDAFAILSDLPTAMSDFDTYVKGRFAGLENIWVGFAGNTFKNYNQMVQFRDALKIYTENAKKLGWRYLNGVDKTLFNAAFMQFISPDDYIHPNTTGVHAIGYNVAEAIKTGYTNNYRDYVTIAFNKSIGTGTFNVYEEVNDNMISFKLADTTFTNTDPLSAGPVVLGTCTEMKNMVTPNAYIPVYVTTTALEKFVAILYFQDYTTIALILPQSISSSFTVHGVTTRMDMLART